MRLSRKDRHSGVPDIKVVGATHEKLAKMVGTTPSKIIFFMHKFRKLGLIDYEGDANVKIAPERLTDMVLRA